MIMASLGRQSINRILASTICSNVNPPHLLHVVDLVEDEPLLAAQVHGDVEPGAVLVGGARPPLGALKAAGVPPRHHLHGKTAYISPAGSWQELLLLTPS